MVLDYVYIFKIKEVIDQILESSNKANNRIIPENTEDKGKGGNTEKSQCREVRNIFD